LSACKISIVVGCDVVSRCREKNDTWGEEVEANLNKKIV
jgi:hypothetical protein